MMRRSKQVYGLPRNNLRIIEDVMIIIAKQTNVVWREMNWIEKDIMLQLNM